MGEQDVPMRAFDPVRLGRYECDAWAAYYRREWRAFLIASVAMVRTGFGMGRRHTLQGAWLVLRANQAWAPYPHNDPDAAREFMRRFYALVAGDQGMSIEAGEAARREVEWWRIHRVHQREDGVSEGDLVDALVALYSYVYQTPGPPMEPAARHRVMAMRLSDEWVEAGCDLSHPLLAQERIELVASYTALRRAVEQTLPSVR